MEPADIALTIQEAEGTASLGLWVEAWDLLETLPPHVRVNEEALAVRLRICTGLQRGEMGRVICRLID